MATHLGEHAFPRDRRVLRIVLLERDVAEASVDARLVHRARLAAVRVAPGVYRRGGCPVQRIVRHRAELVRREVVAVRSKSRHARRDVQERLVGSVLTAPDHVLHVAHRAHRREKRVGLGVHQLRDRFEVLLRRPVDPRLVAGAVRDDARMLPREADDRVVLFERDKVRRLDVDHDSQLVHRLEVLVRRNERVETQEVESQFLALRGDHAVVREIARKLHRLREVAVLRDAAQVRQLAVEAHPLAVRHETADAELLRTRPLRRRQRERVADGILRRPERESLRRQRKIPLRLALRQNLAGGIGD